MSPELHAEYQEVIDWLTDHGVDFDKAEADLRESQRKRDEWLKPSRPKR